MAHAITLTARLQSLKVPPPFEPDRLRSFVVCIRDLSRGRNAVMKREALILLLLACFAFFVFRGIIEGKPSTVRPTLTSSPQLDKDRHHHDWSRFINGRRV